MKTPPFVKTYTDSFKLYWQKMKDGGKLSILAEMQRLKPSGAEKSPGAPVKMRATNSLWNNIKNNADVAFRYKTRDTGNAFEKNSVWRLSHLWKVIPFLLITVPQAIRIVCARALDTLFLWCRQEKCTFLISEKMPNLENFKSLPITTNSAYVQYQDKIFYINYALNECTPLTAKASVLEKGRSRFTSGAILTDDELAAIREATEHIGSDRYYGARGNYQWGNLLHNLSPGRSVLATIPILAIGIIYGVTTGVEKITAAIAWVSNIFLTPLHKSFLMVENAVCNVPGALSHVVQQPVRPPSPTGSVTSSDPLLERDRSRSNSLDSNASHEEPLMETLSETVNHAVKSEQAGKLLDRNAMTQPLADQESEEEAPAQESTVKPGHKHSE